MSTMQSQRRRNRSRSLSMVALLGIWTVSAAAPVVAAVPGLTTVENSSISDSAPVKAVTATCPSGTVLIGGGFNFGGSLNRGELHVPELRPVGNGMEAVAYEDPDGFASNWIVTAVAVCANPLPGLEVVVAISPTSSATNRAIGANCPAGKELIGTLADAGGGGGRVVINRIEPSNTSVAVYANEDGGGTANVWNVKAYAFCADPLPGHAIVQEQSTTTTADYKIVTADCPGGSGTLGGGAHVSLVTGELVLLRASAWSYQGDYHVTAKAAEDANGLSIGGGFWRLHAYAICATL